MNFELYKILKALCLRNRRGLVLIEKEEKMDTRTQGNFNWRLRP